jgi:uncharacterized protein (DUF1810 family)
MVVVMYTYHHERLGEKGTHWLCFVFPYIHMHDQLKVTELLINGSLFVYLNFKGLECSTREPSTAKVFIHHGH